MAFCRTLTVAGLVAPLPHRRIGVAVRRYEERSSAG